MPNVLSPRDLVFRPDETVPHPAIIFASLGFLNLTIFCGCTARFVSDLVGNPKERFFHDAAHYTVFIMSPPSGLGDILFIPWRLSVCHKIVSWL